MLGEKVTLATAASKEDQTNKKRVPNQTRLNWMVGPTTGRSRAKQIRKRRPAKMGSRD